MFDTLERRGRELDCGRRRVHKALVTISKLVLHTGRDADRLTAEDLLRYRVWHRQASAGKSVPGLTMAWTMLREVADLGEHATLKEAVRLGQRPTAELVDAYGLRCRPVRDMLVRYLDERRPSLDYSSFAERARILAGNFWADIERHHPGIDSPHLPDDVAEAWRQRLRTLDNGGRHDTAASRCVRDSQPRPRQRSDGVHRR